MIMTIKSKKESINNPRRQILGAAAALVAVFAGSTLVAPANALAEEGVTEYFAKYSADSAETVDHTTWNDLLAKYIVPGNDGINRVDYDGWKANGHASLKTYLKGLQKVDPRKLGRSEKFAYWANLYNAKTIDVVLEHYPVESIRKITINEGLFGFLKKSVGVGGPWKAKIINVSGKNLSLDNVEHDIMRPLFKDPRVHYAVNCASYGCPNLAAEAFTGANLETLLDSGAKAFVNHPRGISITDGGVKASSIYQWFQVDFGGTEAGVLDHVRKYANPELKKRLEGKNSIASYAYDWSLNTIKSGS